MSHACLYIAWRGLASTKVGGHPEWREKYLHCKECVQKAFQGLSHLILFRYQRLLSLDAVGKSWARSPHTTHRVSYKRAMEMPTVCECLLIPEKSTAIEYCPFSHAEWLLENLVLLWTPLGSSNLQGNSSLNLLRQTSILAD